MTDTVEYKNLEDAQADVIMWRNKVKKLEKALELYQRERDRFKHNNPEITGAYYLTGGYGEVDGNMLPQFVRIVPAYGCALEQIYEKTEKTHTYEGS